MTYLTYVRLTVWDIIQRMWCMLFHKQNWEPHGTGEKCSICGQEYDDDPLYF